ncbi:MAG: hypothetical protein HY096_06465 [Nitrospinae bacterium]|nr:hypothetical protein [Nitrospinota bacterium]
MNIYDIMKNIVNVNELPNGRMNGCNREGDSLSFKNKNLIFINFLYK